MAITPSSITVELHVIVVEHGSQHGDADPAVFVGQLDEINRQALAYVRDLPAGMIYDDGERVIAPLRVTDDGDPVEQLDDGDIGRILDEFHEAATAPWLTTFTREITLDVTVAR
jgi:hypothetical protein